MAPSEAETIGARIAQERRLLGVSLRRDITPADLAALLEVNPATVYRWESGEKAPREEALTAMGKLFGVTAAYLRYGVVSADGSPERVQKKPAVSGGLEITPGPMLTPAQIARAEEKSAQNDAARAAAKSARPTRRPGNGGKSA